MKLSDKVNYFYNDIYQFIEDLREANIIKAEAGSIILNKLSQTFSKNIAFAEDYSKEYKKLDFSKEIEKLTNGFSFRDSQTFLLSDAEIQQAEKIKDEIFKFIRKLTYSEKNISTDVQLYFTDSLGFKVVKDRYLSLL